MDGVVFYSSSSHDHNEDNYRGPSDNDERHGRVGSVPPSRRNFNDGNVQRGGSVPPLGRNNANFSCHWEPPSGSPPLGEVPREDGRSSSSGRRRS